MATPPVRACRSCSTPLPADAQFCPRCGSRTPTEISGGTTVVEPPTPDALAEQRERLQHALGADYVVEHLLGSGGFAQVWAAHDQRLDRRVAVKVLHPELVASRSLIERFKREAQAVAKLRHPGIVPIYGVGEHEGLAWYLMPLIEGASLREALRSGPLPVAEARRILRETAAAVAVAHEAGIVHRDIKPENIMLDGKERRVLVMDFGIAKSVQAGATGLTGTGMIIGTPAYMSPEQATASKEIGPPSDIYSLGVVGFEMITGATPFQADSVAELVLKQVAAPAPSLGAVRTDAPEDLVIAINRCLAKEPAERWRDAADLAGFLEQYVTPALVARTDSKDLRRYARRGWRATRKQAWLGIGAVLVLAFGWTWAARPDVLQLAYAHWASRLRPNAALPPWQLSMDPAAGRFDRQWSAQLFGIGDSLLAVVDYDNPFEGLHLRDAGGAWRSFRQRDRITAAVQQAGVVLLFSDTAVYRWDAGGIAHLARTPFPVASAWAGASELLVARDNGELAWRSGAGWRRVAMPSRVRSPLIVGDRPDRLLIIRRWGLWGDPIWRFDGTTLDAANPNPDRETEWRFIAAATLRGGVTVIAGQARAVDETRRREAAELFLLREDSGRRWRQTLLRGVPRTWWYSIARVSGTADSVVLLKAGCHVRCVADVTTSGFAIASGVDREGAEDLVVLRDGRHLLLSDGTIWFQRGGRWSHASQVPHTTIRAAAELARLGGVYYATAVVGDGLVQGRFSGDSTYENRSLLVPDLPSSRPEAVALGRHEAWILAGGRVFRADCRTTQPCSLRLEPLLDSIASLVQWPAGGALAIGSRGTIAVTAARGWRRYALPAAARAERLVVAAAGPDSSFVVLGERHVVRYSASGATRVLGVLPQRMLGATLIATAAADGAAIVTPGGRMALVDSSGRFVIDEFWPGSSRATSLLRLPEGRFAVGFSEADDDPYAKGYTVVARQDSAGGAILWSVRRAAIGGEIEPRSGVFALSLVCCSGPGQWLLARGMGRSSLLWPLDSVALRRRRLLDSLAAVQAIE